MACAMLCVAAGFSPRTQRVDRSAESLVVRWVFFFILEEFKYISYEST